ncbi:MAG: MarR family transcriptional regulator [Candidatus Dormiibacterota bacterium]
MARSRGRPNINLLSQRARSESLLRQLLHLRDAIESLLQPPRGEGPKADRELLTGRQAHALYIVHQGPTRMGDLARSLHVTPAAATSIADALVALQIIERFRDESDRRLVCLRETERGAAIIRDRNLWEHTAIGGLEAALASPSSGDGELRVDDVIRLVEAAAEHAGHAFRRRSRAAKPMVASTTLRADSQNNGPR